MKRIICLILALLLLCPTAFAAEDLTFAFSKPEGKVGDTVTIVVSSKGAPVACSYKLVMTYDDEVLKPTAVKNINSKGLFMNNLNTTYEGKPAVNALTADAKKAFEGDCDLYSISFEILSAPKSGEATIEIPYYECYDANLKMLDAAFEPCRIKVLKEDDNTNTGDDNTNAGDNNTNTGDDNTNTGDDNTNTGDNNTNTGDDNTNTGDDNTNTGNDNTNTGNDNTNTGDDSTNTGDDNTNTGDDKEDPITDTPASGSAGGSSSDSDETKPVTGEWTIYEQTEEVTHSENGDIIVYKGEFIYDKEENLTDIKLYDEEGKPAGSVKVEKDESGTPQVVEQKLASDDSDKGFNHLYWIIPVAIVLGAGAVAAVMILKSKKKEEESEE